jgi:hypothetical protein
MWLVYNEPDLHGQNHRVYITKADAINRINECYVRKGLEKLDDDVALDEFRVVYWAWEIADEPK